MTSVDVWSDLEAALLGGEEAQHELLPMDEIVDSLNIELRERFESALFIIVKKNFNSTVKDGIAKRGINKLQIDHVLATLLNKRHDEANFYNTIIICCRVRVVIIQLIRMFLLNSSLLQLQMADRPDRF